MIEFGQSPDFDFLSPEYEALFARSSATAFQHPLWLDRLYARLIRPQARGSRIVTGRRKDDGRLVFLLPMAKRRWGPLPVLECADMGVSDYGSPVIDQDAAAMFARDKSLQQELGRTLGGFTPARIQKVRADHLDQLAMFGSIRPAAMGVSAHPLALSAPYSAWREQTLSKKFRTTQDRKRRGVLAQGDLLLEEVTGEAIDEAFGSLRDLRAQRWPKDLLKKPPFFDFYVEMARAGQAAGLTRTYRYSHGGNTVGVIFGLAHKQQFLFLLIGFDYQAYRKSSLGLLMVEDVIKDCIERGDTVFDFTIGDESYKGDFKVESIPMMSVWVGPQPMSSLTSFAFQGLVKLRELKAQSQALYQYALR